LQVSLYKSSVDRTVKEPTEELVDVASRGVAKSQSKSGDPEVGSTVSGASASWSKKHRRNSSLEVQPREGGLQICKTYHQVYTASEEYDAYQRVAAVCQRVEGIRIPDIYEVDSDQNSIQLEFIAGQDLRDSIATHGFDVLRPHEEALLCLFAHSRAVSIRFDSDPANFIVSDTGELVLVDPVCEQVALTDFAIVVFVFGLVKATLSKPWRLFQFAGSLKSFCGRYCDRCPEASPAAICGQLADYLSVVIRWNRESVAGESVGLLLLRRCWWVPLLSVCRLCLRASARGMR
jgi:hypothetical protein